MKPLLPLAVLFAAVASAQYIGYPTPGLPRTKDGKPNLTAKTPRTSDGKPDLSGIWHPQTTSIAEVRTFFPNFNPVEVPGMGPTTVSKYAYTLFPVSDDPLGMNVMTPEAQAIFAPPRSERNGSLADHPLPSALDSARHESLGTPPDYASSRRYRDPLGAQQ